MLIVLSQLWLSKVFQWFLFLQNQAYLNNFLTWFLYGLIIVIAEA